MCVRGYPSSHIHTWKWHIAMAWRWHIGTTYIHIPYPYPRYLCCGSFPGKGFSTPCMVSYMLVMITSELFFGENNRNGKTKAICYQIGWDNWRHNHSPWSVFNHKFENRFIISVEITFEFFFSCERNKKILQWIISIKCTEIAFQLNIGSLGHRMVNNGAIFPNIITFKSKPTAEKSINTSAWWKKLRIFLSFFFASTNQLSN